jgi:hypothetical protein
MWGGTCCEGLSRDIKTKAQVPFPRLEGTVRTAECDPGSDLSCTCPTLRLMNISCSTPRAVSRGNLQRM